MHFTEKNGRNLWWEYWQHSLRRLPASSERGQALSSAFRWCLGRTQKRRKVQKLGAGKVGIESNDFATASTCSSPYVIPATVPREREAPKWMIYEDYKLTMGMLCNYHQGLESWINRSTWWGFFYVEDCLRCGERRQEKFMMPSLPLKNLCGDQANTKKHL